MLQKNVSYFAYAAGQLDLPKRYEICCAFAYPTD
jgi:hypothetical protein